jgi:DNA polymerase elongation subunit (family B)
MTNNEKDLLEVTHKLFDKYDPDVLSYHDMEDFNTNLIDALEKFNVSLGRYHELILEEIESSIELE